MIPYIFPKHICTRFLIFGHYNTLELSPMRLFIVLRTCCYLESIFLTIVSTSTYILQDCHLVPAYLTIATYGTEGSQQLPTLFYLREAFQNILTEPILIKMLPRYLEHRRAHLTLENEIFILECLIKIFSKSKYFFFTEICTKNKVVFLFKRHPGRRLNSFCIHNARN